MFSFKTIKIKLRYLLQGIESTEITIGEFEIFSIIDNYIHSIIDVGTRSDTFYCL